MDSKKLAQLCWECADNKKAEDIVILDVRELSSVADYFVICSGTSEPHLRAISDQILDTLRDDKNLRPRAIDGHRVDDRYELLTERERQLYHMLAEGQSNKDIANRLGRAGLLRCDRARDEARRAREI